MDDENKQLISSLCSLLEFELNDIITNAFPESVPHLFVYAENVDNNFLLHVKFETFDASQEDVENLSKILEWAELWLQQRLA